MQIVPTGPPQTAVQRDQQLRTAAQDLETTFLVEMLKSAGLGQTRGAFGGGAGEDQFASFLLREQAAALVQAGGIGLSETIFESLKERNDATPID